MSATTVIALFLAVWSVPLLFIVALVIVHVRALRREDEEAPLAEVIDIRQGWAGQP